MLCNRLWNDPVITVMYCERKLSNNETVNLISPHTSYRYTEISFIGVLLLSIQNSWQIIRVEWHQETLRFGVNETNLKHVPTAGFLYWKAHNFMDII